MDIQDLENRFSFHPTNEDHIRQAHETVRNTCLRLALDLNSQIADCDEKKEAIKCLEQVMFWANAAIARYPQNN